MPYWLLRAQEQHSFAACQATTFGAVVHLHPSLHQCLGPRSCKGTCGQWTKSPSQECRFPGQGGWLDGFHACYCMQNWVTPRRSEVSLHTFQCWPHSGSWGRLECPSRCHRYCSGISEGPSPFADRRGGRPGSPAVGQDILQPHWQTSTGMFPSPRMLAAPCLREVQNRLQATKHTSEQVSVPGGSGTHSSDQDMPLTRIDDNDSLVVRSYSLVAVMEAVHGAQLRLGLVSWSLLHPC